jgi:hypothetical protein
LAAIGLSISLDIIIKKEWGRLWQVGLVFLTWLVSFGILYFISYRFLTSSSILTGFFARDFMPVPPWTDLHWFRLAWIGLIHSRIGLPEGIITNIASFVVLAGCVSICLRKWQWGLVLIMPFVFTLIASGLEKYPFTGRLLLFLFPSVFFLIAEGLERIRLLLSKLNPWLAYAACAVLVLVFLYHEGTQAYKIARHPDMYDDIKPALSYLSQNKRNRDLIYIYHGAQPAFNYYAPFYNFSGKYFEMGIDARGAPAKYIQDINNLIGQGRVWFIFSHVPVSQDKNTNERLIFLNYLNQIGKQKRSFTSKQKDVYLYLYDLSVQKP